MSSDVKGKYLRQLPAVGKLMEHPGLRQLSEICPRALMLDAIRNVLESYKNHILSASNEDNIKKLDFSIEHILEEISALAAENARMSLRRAINATGNVLNNDLGRAPLNEAAQKAIQDVARGYSNLAVDIKTGETGDRDTHVQNLLSILTGAESGTVLNNNAAAVMLILNTAAEGKEVIVSRGEIIESDGFRLPDIISRSDARMVAVGTTNKTHLKDYGDALSDNTGAILKVHNSNYRISGFTEGVSIQELAELARGHDIPVIYDMGSGCLFDLAKYGFPEEPSVIMSIKHGADILCFSGDKLLSGPQSGVVIGRSAYISMMKKNPLYRVLRANKLTIAALEATLRAHLDADKILETNSILRFLSRPLEEIENMSRTLVDSISKKLADMVTVRVEDGYSQVGYASLNPERFPTKLVYIKPDGISAEMLGMRLRSRPVPIFALIREEHIVIDLRAVQADELEEIAAALLECCMKNT